MIDTIVKLDQFLVILQNSPIIGYDSEFKPSFLSTEVEVRRQFFKMKVVFDDLNFFFANYFICPNVRFTFTFFIFLKKA